MRKCEEIIKLLLSYQADCSVTNKKNKTAWDLSKEFKESSISTLFEKGINTNSTKMKEEKELFNTVRGNVDQTFILTPDDNSIVLVFPEKENSENKKQLLKINIPCQVFSNFYFIHCFLWTRN